MCGINGIASTKRPVDRSILEAMRDVIRHRGPDGEGLYLKDNIGLGHRRLSIVDVALGRQPMTNEDGRVVIVYNGEIYNHADWRPSLEQRGHVYRTHCDTETILHLYEEHGVEVVNKLRGMFAFAIWDDRQQLLFLARDRFGVKPLYYYHASDGSLYFASEIKSLLATRSLAASINFAAMPDFLANHAPSGEMTLFEGVRKLLPGHTLIWRDGRVEIQRYWNISFADVDFAPGKSDNDYVAEWSELFRESVRLRLMADVPLGMFLSGGIDSSAIAATMSKMVSQPIKTFSVAFAEREANELEFARLVAKRFGTDHHEIVVSPNAFFDRLPELVWHEDEPLAHPSSVALNFVSTLAAQHVKVVLTGEGSDEMLGGYDRYRKTIYNWILGRYYHGLTSEKVRCSVMAIMGRMLRPTRLNDKLRRTFLHLDPTLEKIYFNNFAVFPLETQPCLLSSEVKAQVGEMRPYVEMNRLLEDVPSASMLNKLLYVDIHTYLQELLMKQDQMSMAASIESRVPFLDHKLCEFTARMPGRLKLRGITTKWVLRQSMKDLLPPEILKRRKMGFPVPLAQWFRGPFSWVLDEYLLSATALRRGIFNPAFVAQLVKRHQSGAENNAQRLWALVNFEIWCRRFLGP